MQTFLQNNIFDKKANSQIFEFRFFIDMIDSVVDVIKHFLEEIWISPKLRNWKSLFLCLNLH